LEELTDTATKNPFRYEGFYYDSGIQGYDMQAREYRPDVGRFLSQDRFQAAGADVTLQADPLTQNRYAFAGGNPVSHIELDSTSHSRRRSNSARSSRPSRLLMNSSWSPSRVAHGRERGQAPPSEPPRSLPWRGLWLQNVRVGRGGPRTRPNDLRFDRIAGVEVDGAAWRLDHLPFRRLPVKVRRSLPLTCSIAGK